MSGESEKTLRDTFEEAKVSHRTQPKANASVVLPLVESRSLPSVH